MYVSNQKPPLTLTQLTLENSYSNKKLTRASELRQSAKRREFEKAISISKGVIQNTSIQKILTLNHNQITLNDQQVIIETYRPN